MSTNKSSTGNNYKEFTHKAWITVGIVALVAVTLLFVKTTFNVFLLLLAGILVAIYFRGLSDLICSKTNWKQGLCLTLSIVGTFLILFFLFWLMGAKLMTQAQQLTESIPSTIDNARSYLNQSTIGRQVVNKISSPSTIEKGQSIAGSFFQSTFGIIGDIYIILLLAIFFVISPSSYKQGVIRLVPVAGRPKATEVLDQIAINLKKWLKGKIFSMFIVFILTAVALLIMGIPLWLVLAIIAGLLNFIPNFGPLIALIPAVLVGLVQSPATAAIIAGIYILIQTVESSIITPSIQKKLVEIPPALIIVAQLLVAPLTGFWGLLLATPLMLITIVLVKKLYIEEQEKG